MLFNFFGSALVAISSRCATWTTIKHSAAKNIVIDLVASGDGISIVMTDDGKGFDTSAAASGNGLKSMRRRAGYLMEKLPLVPKKEKAQVWC